MREVVFDGEGNEGEAASIIEEMAHRMGREPYTFYDDEGIPWAVLMRYDHYCELEQSHSDLSLVKSLLPAPEAKVVDARQNLQSL